MKKIVLLLVISLGVLITKAQKSEVFVKGGVAINGYDAVAYFTEGKPVKGDDQFVYNWDGASWLFSSRQNLDSFKSDPEKFAPQYGGYCAFGMFQGHKASTDPNAWTIVNGKLYFNYNLKVKQMWTEKREEKIEIADKNWPDVKSKE